MVNKDSNKIRVVTTYGIDDAFLGVMTPEVHMNVRHGIDSMWIKSLDSGNYQVGLALSSGGTVVRKAYPWDLKINETVAQVFGWPNTINYHPVVHGHSGIFPNGVFGDTDTNTSTFLGGDGQFHSSH